MPSVSQPSGTEVNREAHDDGAGGDGTAKRVFSAECCVAPEAVVRRTLRTDVRFGDDRGDVALHGLLHQAPVDPAAFNQRIAFCTAPRAVVRRNRLSCADAYSRVASARLSPLWK